MIPTKEGTKNIAVRIPRSVYKKAVELAKKEGVKEADVYRHAINSFFATIVNEISTDSSIISSNKPGAA